MSQAAKTQMTEAPTFPYFTEEHAMLRETVKQFCDREIAPHSEEWDEAGIFPRELFKKAGDLGLFGIRTDPRWGGTGLDWWATAAYLEGLSYAHNGGVAMALLAILDLHEARPGVPILNGITALVKMGEMGVRVAKLSGGAFISKRLQYAPPGVDQIAEIRKYYGDVYPSVPEA